MGKTPEELRSGLTGRYPALEACAPEIGQAFDALRACYRQGGKLLLCGNGGSAADCGHIAGELMKGFLKKRPLPASAKERFPGTPEGRGLAEGLQGALPCIALTEQATLNTAFANDVNPEFIFAQQVYGYGRAGDVLLGISTSGNARNVCNAAITARAVGMRVIGLTGSSGGTLAGLSDVAICVPEVETYRVQEYHLPVYHALCAMLEAEFFAEDAPE